MAAFVPLAPVSWPLILFHALGGSLMLALLGLLGGLWAEKFDQMAAVTNFVITPLSFLSGVFYSIHSLPPFWAWMSRFNPFFYLIDGFRYGFFGIGDAPIWQSLAWGAGTFTTVSAACLWMLARGYKLRP